MRKLFINCLLLSIPVIFTSCEFDDNGDIQLSTFGWLIIVIVVLTFIVSMVSTIKESKKSKDKMKDLGMDYSEFIPMGTYAGGHPKMDNTVENIYIRHKDKQFTFYTITVYGVSMPQLITDASIPCEDIADITIEDASSIEKKITVGRILLVGIFALGWRKKKKNELAFLVIEWKKGKFEHSTTFSFEGKDAFQKANTARNQLIKFCE